MKKIWTILLIGSILGITLIGGTASAASLTTTNQTITITNAEAKLLVTEDLEITNKGYDTATALSFWIQLDAENIAVLAVEKNIPLSPTIAGNVYTCNLTTSNLNLTKDQTINIRITYTIPKTAQYFQKTITYTTDSITVFFNNNKLFSSEVITPGTSLNLLLYNPTEAPLNITYIIVVVILVILLIILALLLLKRQRRKTTTTTPGTESEELLTTKKNTPS